MYTNVDVGDQVEVEIDHILYKVLEMTSLKDFQKDYITELIGKNRKKIPHKGGDTFYEISYIKIDVEINDLEVEIDDGDISNYIARNYITEEIFGDSMEEGLMLKYHTLEDQYKAQIVQEFYQNYTWEKLEKIKENIQNLTKNNS